MTLLQGDLRFLIGPNGAGKTTLIDAITGLVPATGSVNKSGVELIGKKVHKIARLGVGRTFQTASVFEQFTVLQNLDIAAGAGRSALTLLRRRKSVLPPSRRRSRSPALAPSSTLRPASSRTARSSGSRSACCSCRTPRCCCSTNRWRA